MVSQVACATALYSASVDDRATMSCFLDCHEMGLAPRKTQYAPVERRLDWSPAQSASKNVWNCVLVVEEMWKGWLLVTLRYRKILLTAYQWMFWGLCMYWHTLFTSNEISGLVKAKYCKLPKTLRYNETSKKGGEFVGSSWKAVDMGVETPFDLSILRCVRRSLMSLVWPRRNPCSFLVTSIPRK